jgi:hypothetical protein
MTLAAHDGTGFSVFMAFTALPVIGPDQVNGVVPVFIKMTFRAFHAHGIVIFQFFTVFIDVMAGIAFNNPSPLIVDVMVKCHRRPHGGQKRAVSHLGDVLLGMGRTKGKSQKNKWEKTGSQREWSNHGGAPFYVLSMHS